MPTNHSNLDIRLAKDADEPPRNRLKLGSVLLGKADPARLVGWYQAGFGVTPDNDGFIDFGAVAVLIDFRDDVATGSK